MGRELGGDSQSRAAGSWLEACDGDGVRSCKSQRPKPYECAQHGADALKSP